MRSDILDEILNKNKVTTSVYRGCHPCDHIPIFETPYAIIVNTDNSQEPGEHWVLLYVTDIVEYFDSFGRNWNSKLYPKEFIAYMKQFVNGRKTKYNPKIVESLLGNCCGEYCAFYLYRRCQNVKNILSPFGANLKYNDLLVIEFVKHM